MLWEHRRTCAVNNPASATARSSFSRPPERELGEWLRQQRECFLCLLPGGVLGNWWQLQFRQQVQLGVPVIAGGGEQRAVGAQGRCGDDPADFAELPAAFPRQDHAHESGSAGRRRPKCCAWD